jgi:hypothetical protein
MRESSLLRRAGYPEMGLFLKSPKSEVNSGSAFPDMALNMETGNSHTKTGESQTQVQLHVCPECSSKLVQPVAWEQVDRSSDWRLWRRCPECEWSGHDVHREGTIDDYDEQLDFGTRELAEELRVLQYANMEEAIDRFVGALQADQILPEDF